MKNKLPIIIFLLLFLISASGFVIGYLNRDTAVIQKPEEKKLGIKYIYYLENIIVDEMPINEVTTDADGNQVVTNSYLFSTYTCDSNVSGNFDTESWTFNPIEEVEGATCSIYFVKSKYEVTLTALNGVPSEDNPKFINRQETGIFKIKPNDGYNFSKVECSNGKEAKWDSSTKTLKIEGVMSDVACTVSFDVKTLTMKVEVEHGISYDPDTVHYGDSASVQINPAEGYTYKKGIKCSNGQVATVDNDQFVRIEKLTDDTVCNVKLEKKDIVYKTLTLIVDDETNYKITSGSKTMNVEDGKTLSLQISFENDEEPDLKCDKQKYTSRTIEDGVATFEWIGFAEDTKCTIVKYDK